MQLSPVARISAGLVMLTVSALLFGQLLGVVPDTRAAEIDSRKIIAESLAVQVSSSAAGENRAATLQTIRSVVERNASVVSVGLRSADGELVMQSGNHVANWQPPSGEKSTVESVKVPMFKDEQRWGWVEVQFQPLGFATGPFKGSFLSLVLFVAVSGFIAFQLFLRRTLRELNPDAVIPERVRTALDTLAEGVLIIDASELIVFANETFASKIGQSPERLLGRPVADLDWQLPDGGELPWLTLLRGDATPGPVDVSLSSTTDQRFALVVNATAISGGAGQEIRGVMATFDDVTELEKANDELRHALKRLETNETEIRRQNQELQVLATRDSLTGCLNRRSLFQGFDALIEEAKSQDTPLACIMIDLDHFKAINDQFGHQTGDRVIRKLAEILIDLASPDDLVGRYGGEEFCVVTPGRDAGTAAEFADRIRDAVRVECRDIAVAGSTVTASFGVSELADPEQTNKELVDHADQALYQAKESGRDCVAVYAPDASVVMDSGHPATSDEAVDSENGREMISGLRAQVRELQDALAQRSHDAVLDRVTGMPGRLLLLDRATQAIERGKRFRHHVAALSLTLAGLPRVRDALGDLAAERFRQTATERIKATLRSSDSIGKFDDSQHGMSVARLGAEEIGILLTDLKDTHCVDEVVRRLQVALNLPQEIAGNEISLSADIGISLFPADSLDAVTLLRHASAAMHDVSRESGRNRSRYYSAPINARSKRRLQLESELNRAIEHNEFIVHYQPKLSLLTGAITGVEALLRWNNPRLGIVPPDEFISVAEQMDCIGAISDKTLMTVCREIARWQEQGLGSVPVAINLSPVEFQEPELAERITRRIREAGIDPTLIELEITESVLMENHEMPLKNMRKLSAAGLSISVDDFGTGYSTLRCLNRFPVAKIKIDRSFLVDLVNAERDSAMVSGVIALGHSMGLTVVAEGVEEKEQLDYLRDLHCDEVQGYYLSRPVPREQMTELLCNPIRLRTLMSVPAATGHVGSAPQLVGMLNNIERSAHS